MLPPELGQRCPGFWDQLCRACLLSCRSEEHTSELQSQSNLVCRLLLEKKKPRALERDLERRRSQRARVPLPEAAERGQPILPQRSQRVALFPVRLLHERDVWLGALRPA